MARTVRATYPPNQSPFFRLRKRQDLYDLLGVSKEEVLWLLRKGGENYNVFSTPSGRRIEEPKPRLKAVHKRIHRLLARITAPEYLHSGQRDRTYVSNAVCHLGKPFLMKADIKKFFPSTKSKYVYRYFRTALECSEDVAAVLTDISCVEGHLPTGSHISQVLAYWAYAPMFDEMSALAAREGFAWSCYVDDLTFSGGRPPIGLLREVKRIAGSYSLVIHKTSVHGPNDARRVTGVILAPGGMRVRNEQLKNIQISRRAYLASEKRSEVSEVHYRSLVGRLYAAGQVEPRFRAIAAKAVREHARTKIQKLH